MTVIMVSFFCLLEHSCRNSALVCEHIENFIESLWYLGQLEGGCKGCRIVDASDGQLMRC